MGGAGPSPTPANSGKGLEFGPKACTPSFYEVSLVDDHGPQRSASCSPVEDLAERPCGGFGCRKAEALDIPVDRRADRIVAIGAAAYISERSGVMDTAAPFMIEGQRHCRHDYQGSAAHAAWRIGSEPDLVDRREDGALALARWKIDDEGCSLRHGQSSSDRGSLARTSIGIPAQLPQK